MKEISQREGWRREVGEGEAGKEHEREQLLRKKEN